jgi:NAD+ kinase
MRTGFHALQGNRIPVSSVLMVLKSFLERGHELFLSYSLHKSLGEAASGLPFTIFKTESEVRGLHLFLSLGGDGTLLDSQIYTLRNQIPVLGLNFGRLGFLPCIPSTEIPQLLDLAEEGKLPVQSRSVLEVETEGVVNPFLDFPYALNEVAIIKKDSSSMIHIRTDVDGVFLNEYWGDGLILASPTGSTGYSLSCGGPILWPESETMVLTPVSPHNLSMRPLVLSSSTVVNLIPSGRSPKVMLSMDSRSRPFPVNQTVRIKCSQEKAHFVKLKEPGFPSTLREKLYWGKDFRN